MQIDCKTWANYCVVLRTSLEKKATVRIKNMFRSKCMKGVLKSRVVRHVNEKYAAKSYKKTCSGQSV
jgi:hypothetical protein